ncbi:hypothetical protein GCM10009795_062290 [Nocardioides hankookensis]|uniref:DUF4307 domain-containing protein n=1 Tax=Nocardioides hankookensis TaxID=443157 RepID=A0ABW1LMW6_9ACTN
MKRIVTIVAVAAALLAAVVTSLVVRGSADEPATGLTVGWGGGEGRPACVYAAGDDSAHATIAIDGSVPHEQSVTITVTAYADENTSDLVGTGTRTVEVDGDVHESVDVTIPVDRPPHVDEDGVAACALDWTY